MLLEQLTLTEQFWSDLTSGTGVESFFKLSPVSIFFFGQLLFLPVTQQTLPCLSCTGWLCGNCLVLFGRKCHDSEIWFCSEVEEHTNKHKIILNPKFPANHNKNYLFFLKTEPFHPARDLSKFDRNIFEVSKQKPFERGQNILY